MAVNFRRPYKPIVKKRDHKINEEIVSSTVRVSGEGVPSSIMSITEALKLAADMGVDLVEITPGAVPPVCRLIEYSKLMYEKKKKEKDNKKKQENSELKELRLTPTTDDHDLNFKTKNAINWLKDGDKVKVVVVFKGRMIQHKTAGELLLLKFSQGVADFGKVEQLPKLEGFKMIMIVVPNKKK